ncbi:MAG: zf-HC2 domain-containing protein [Candidatus Schekmanbacteria bacterium]|nr:zf-HC2 domain-containing protein [Candidatus Schekmanbacteria bacterium]
MQSTRTEQGVSRSRHCGVPPATWAAYLDGGLQADALAAFERHLGGCPWCREVIRGHRRIIQLARLSVPELIPVDVTLSVRACLEKDERVAGQRRATAPTGITAWFASAALLVTLALGTVAAWTSPWAAPGFGMQFAIDGVCDAGQTVLRLSLAGAAGWERLGLADLTAPIVAAAENVAASAGAVARRAAGHTPRSVAAMLAALAVVGLVNLAARVGVPPFWDARIPWGSSTRGCRS